MSRARATQILSAVLVVLGIAILVQTAIHGGGIGYLLGALAIAAGGLRFWLVGRGG